MTAIEVTDEARDNLADLVALLSLPLDTRLRVIASISQLATSPRMGKALEPPFAPARWIIGPWAWMVIVYLHLEEEDVVMVVAIQDGRTQAAASHFST